MSGASLYDKAQTASPEQIQGICDEIIANQDKGKSAMRDAGQLYFQGKLMGTACVKIDYVKAVTLMQKAGDTAQYNAFVRLLRDRAASGNAAAKSALGKLHLKP